MDGNLVSGDQPYIFPWEHENVQNVQDTLNSQPSIYQYPPPWSETETGKFLEDEETLDLSSTSTILSYSYSPTRQLQPPVMAATNTRLTILPPRNQMLDPATHPQPHQLSPPVHHQQHQQQQQQQVHQPALASTSIKHDKERRVRARPRSVHEQQEIERPCKVCGEKAGKHSYYGGQVGWSYAICMSSVLYIISIISGLSFM